MKRNVSPPTPVSLVWRLAPLLGSLWVTVPKLHAGGAVAVAAATGATGTGDFVGTIAGGLTAALVGVRKGPADVTVGSGVTVAGSDVDVTGT